jgi:chromosome segregation ATPase
MSAEGTREGMIVMADTMQTTSRTIANNPNENQPVGVPASVDKGEMRIDLLARRAEKLIEAVRAAHRQLDTMMTRPEEAISDANASASALIDLHEKLKPQLEQARTIEQSTDKRVRMLRGVLFEAERASHGILERVERAHKLTELFKELMASAEDRLQAIESASSEAKTARKSAIETAKAVERIRVAGETWQRNLKSLSAEHKQLVSSAEAATANLRAAIDDAHALDRGYRSEIKALTELLKQSRQERQAWDELLARVPQRDSVETSQTHPADLQAEARPKNQATQAESVDTPTRTPPPQSPQTQVAPVGPGPAALADRMKRIADLVREVGEDRKSAPPPARRDWADAAVADTP